MSQGSSNYIEEHVFIDGVSATRKRKDSPERKSREYYLHCPMGCVTALANAKIPSTAWPLALWIIWNHRVSSGGPASISNSFAGRAGVDGRAARRHAVGALEASGLFQIFRNGTAAIKITPSPSLKDMLSRAKSKTTSTQEG
jgi:hypothetical protein